MKLVVVICSVLAIVFTFNLLNTDPYTAAVISEVSKQGAPKALSRGLSVYSYSEAAPKLVLGYRCIEEAYRMADFEIELARRPYDREARERLDQQAEFAYSLCDVASELH